MCVVLKCCFHWSYYQCTVPCNICHCKMKHLTSRASTGKEGRLWLRLSLCFECGTAYNIMRLHWLVVEQQWHVCVHFFRGPCSNQDLRQTQTIKAYSPIFPNLCLVLISMSPSNNTAVYCIRVYNTAVLLPLLFLCIDYTLQHCYCYYSGVFNINIDYI